MLLLADHAATFHSRISWHRMFVENDAGLASRRLAHSYTCTSLVRAGIIGLTVVLLAVALPLVRLLVKQRLAVGWAIEGVAIVTLLLQAAFKLLLMTHGWLHWVALLFEHLSGTVIWPIKSFSIVAFVCNAACVLLLFALDGFRCVIVKNLTASVVLSWCLSALFAVGCLLLLRGRILWLLRVTIVTKTDLALPAYMKIKVINKIIWPSTFRKFKTRDNLRLSQHV